MIRRTNGRRTERRFWERPKLWPGSTCGQRGMLEEDQSEAQPGGKRVAAQNRPCLLS